MAGWDRVASFHRAEIQEAELLLSRKIISARLQPGKDAAIVIGEIVELLAALDEVGIPVHEEFIWLHFVNNLPPGYEFIQNNLRGSKEPLTRIVLEDALWSRYNIQSGGTKGKTIPDSGSFVSGSEAGRGVGGGGGRGGTSKGKLYSRGPSEGLSSQAKIVCNYCQKPGHIRPNCPERQCFKLLLVLLLLLLFLTFSVLVAYPKKILYTVANPARGLLNREKRTKEEV